MLLKRLSLLLLLWCAACSPAPETSLTAESLPAQNDVPPTVTRDPLLATMERPTIPPLATYSSDLYAYSFNYPATSQIEVANNGQTAWLDKQIWVYVSDLNPEAAVGEGAFIESADNTLVNGLPARRLSGSIGAIGGNTPQRYQTIVIPNGARFYSITVYELRNDVVLPADRQIGEIPLTALSLFDLVVGTFILLN